MARSSAYPPRILITGFLALAACVEPPTKTPSISPTAPVPSTLTPAAGQTRPLVPTATLGGSNGFLRKSADSLRVMTYNVNWDSIFPDDDPKNSDLRTSNRVDAFARILRAIRPDIVCLQEIDQLHDEKEIGEYLEGIVGSEGDQKWHVVHVRDTVIASQSVLVEDGYELITGGHPPTLMQAAALVDLPDAEYGSTDLYMICSHFKSGGTPADILLRERQADIIMAQVRDFETPGGNLDLPYGTPFVILGDFNAYDTDPALQIRTLTQGDISNERSYGVDLEPDWDGTALEDAMPGHNALGIDFYTWRNDAEPFEPWALDRVIFSDSVLQEQNAFVLNTTILPHDVLETHGLLRHDVILDPGSGNYDHLPVVVDFQVDKGG